MKFEYKRKQICKAKVARISVSMTVNEARDIISDSRQILRQTGFINYGTDKLWKGLQSELDLHESVLVVQTGETE